MAGAATALRLRSLFTTVFVVCFICGNVFLLLGVMFEEPSLTRVNLPLFTTLDKHFVRKGNEWRLPTAIDGHRVVRSVEDQMLDCGILKGMRNVEFIASGWTKAAYRAVHNGSRQVAVKTVNINGHDVSECLRKGPHENLVDCYKRASSKIVKEIVLLRDLVHDNIVKLLGYCVPNDAFSPDISNHVAVITELGEPFDLIRLLQMSWEDRLRLSLGLAKILQFLARSPLGPLQMNDFRRQQFVFVNGSLKLSDMDDISVGDAECQASSDCQVFLASHNRTVTVECHQGRCRGLTDKLNVLHAGRHFITFILPHGAPSTLHQSVAELQNAYGTAEWTSEKILKETKRIVDVFVNGKYRKILKKNYLKYYKKLPHSDLPGQYDYHCRMTLSPGGCTLSMFNAQEAAQFCFNSPDCKAFVMTLDTTWTGRKIVHFKSNYTTHSTKNDRTVLYIPVT